MPRRNAPLHPESLLRVPLVAQMLDDPNVRLRPVAVDNGWRYHDHVPISTTGFNPLLRSVFYARKSALAEWLRRPRASARALNVRDRLVTELFFAVHDYLHCWAYLAIQSLFPELGFGTAPIRERNVEDFVFCHLVTEAVATVGLDYWYLCAVDLDEVCDIGTKLEALTASYDEERLDEYRRFEPRFVAQAPEFFGEIAKFYCTGEFPSFDLRALKRSPVLLGWVEHELGYGERQREYIRRWLSYLSDDAVRFPAERLRAPVDCSGRWKTRMIRELGARLWDKVKNGNPHRFRATFAPSRVWRRRDFSRKDFRFLSADAFRREDLKDAFAGEGADDSFRHFFYQFVSSHDVKAFDPSLVRLFPEVVRLRDYEVAAALFANQRRLPPSPGGPVDLLTLN
jgi:hypothetical protein